MMRPANAHQPAVENDGSRPMAPVAIDMASIVMASVF